MLHSVTGRTFSLFEGLAISFGVSSVYDKNPLADPGALLYTSMSFVAPLHTSVQNHFTM